MGAAHGITSIACLWKPLIKPKLTKKKKKTTNNQTHSHLFYLLFFYQKAIWSKTTTTKSSILETVSRILLPINS